MYRVTKDNATVKIDAKDETIYLANFSATIEKEIRYEDGNRTQTTLIITGKQGNKTFPAVEVHAEKFAALSWVLSAWGVSAVIQPGSGAKEDLRTAIQLASKPEKLTVFTHTGWTNINDKPAYLHRAGAITADGNNEAVTVRLPNELQYFNLESNADPILATINTINLGKIGPPDIMWPMIASIIGPLHGPVDYAIHISGRTGTFKSEIASLCQSHYGQHMDARHLPGSWSSTANALEAQTFRAKNALFVIDDFIPVGSSWQLRAYQKTADQIIRGQGNQAGRARLNDTSSLQTTMYPRGGILSTGEDTPEGSSMRARMFIIEISPGDIDKKLLTKAQAKRSTYAAGLAAYIRHIAQNPYDIKTDADKIRDSLVDIGHSRTPSTAGHMIAAVTHYLRWACISKAIGEKRTRALIREATAAIRDGADRQGAYLAAVDPCEVFCEAIRHMLVSHIMHFRTPDGGIPRNPTTLGWSEEGSSSDIKTYKSHGKKLGWADWDADELLIDISGGYGDLKRHAQITFTKQTMLKRLKDANLLLRVDEARQRNTVRMTCERHPRQVIIMSLSRTLELNEAQ